MLEMCMVFHFLGFQCKELSQSAKELAWFQVLLLPWLTFIQHLKFFQCYLEFKVDTCFPEGFFFFFFNFYFELYAFLLYCTSMKFSFMLLFLSWEQTALTCYLICVNMPGGQFGSILYFEFASVLGEYCVLESQGKLLLSVPSPFQVGSLGSISILDFPSGDKVFYSCALISVTMGFN